MVCLIALLRNFKVVTDREDLPPPVEECGCMSERRSVEDSGYEYQFPIQETGHSDTWEMVTGKNSSCMTVSTRTQAVCLKE